MDRGVQIIKGVPLHVVSDLGGDRRKGPCLFNDDETVTLRWEASADDERPIEVVEAVEEEPAPF